MTTNDALPRPQRSREAFYGRHKGKALSPLQASLLGEPLDRLRVDLDAQAPEDPRDLFAGRQERLRLEIGFGGGEHLHHETARFPQDGFIGVEPFVNGMAKMLVRLETDPRANLRLYDDDAVRLLDWLPPACLDGVDLFYPDPWHKMKHWKRRFVSARNLDRLARVLKPGAPFRFASDIDSYVDWTLALCASHDAFKAPLGTPDDWTMPYEAWPGTRYEAKAHREGRRGRYLTFVRAR